MSDQLDLFPQPAHADRPPRSSGVRPLPAFVPPSNALVTHKGGTDRATTTPRIPAAAGPREAELLRSLTPRQVQVFAAMRFDRLTADQAAERIGVCRRVVFNELKAVAGTLTRLGIRPIERLPGPSSRHVRNVSPELYKWL